MPSSDTMQRAFTVHGNCSNAQSGPMQNNKRIMRKEYNDRIQEKLEAYRSNPDLSLHTRCIELYS